MNLETVLTNLPFTDIEAAIADPTNLGKEAQVIEDIIRAALPGVDGAVVAGLINLFVYWVYASGGGTIAAGTYKDAQTTQNRGGRNA